MKPTTTKPTTKKTPKPKITVAVYDDGRFTVTINGKPAKPYQSCSRRACFVAAGFIVKIGGPDDRVSEHVRYKSIPSHDKKYFVPVVASGKINGCTWIAQPFLKFRRGKSSNQAIKIIERLADRYDLWDVSSDIRINWSILPNGQPIIYDYEL